MLFFVKREDRRMGVTRMGKTTIFLADDDEGVRRTLRTFFEGLPGYRVVGEACDGMEAVEGCRRRPLTWRCWTSRCRCWTA